MLRTISEMKRFEIFNTTFPSAFFLRACLVCDYDNAIGEHQNKHCYPVALEPSC
jgi:hypothetical protein